MLEPDGQGVPDGAVIVPPVTVQLLLQVLLTMVTLSGATVKEGHVWEGAIATPLKIVFAAAVASTVATDPAPVSSTLISLLSADSVVVAYITGVEPEKSAAIPKAPTVEPEPVPSV
jgi:hypothetical protein